MICSHFGNILLIQENSDVLDAFKVLKTEVETQTDRKIKIMNQLQ